MRLIDADAIPWFVEGIGDIPVVTKEEIDSMPTVDAVPVIRCKDCKYWLPHTQFGYDADWGRYHNYCERHLPDDDFYAFIKEADDFCSWAKRKEE